ncbi:Hypothetical Protein FCC1311_088662 [Hondaea fermentalgiana]|uniref:tRNA pseudouridine(55) synthase n=1 Tax=Hondaea fermentalgiana TaxID=2315210 RepID=A0A2R5GW51_9STRA|nr:Hypothetical Protein FCC1311_088662 [Hondaea fermentalgiana]|eukprot:GBG32641.1 Hypothetical Protein FCC1311_088662 [Hondaea fermentalgiana]
MTATCGVACGDSASATSASGVCGTCLGLRSPGTAEKAADLVAQALRAHRDATTKQRGANQEQEQVEQHRYALEISVPASQMLWSDLSDAESFGDSHLAKTDVAAAFKSVVREKLREKLRENDGIVLDTEAQVTARLSVRHDASDEAARALLIAEKLGPSRKRKRGEADLLSRARLTELVGRLKRQSGSTGPDNFIPSHFEDACAMDVSLTRAPIFVQGRYRKLARGVSQTPWLLKNNPAPSVESLIAPALKERSGATSFKFHSAGREDIDVRMLGGGRPFVVELENASRIPTQQELVDIQEEHINKDPEGRVEVLDLVVADRTCMDRLREGALSKKKQYTCLVWTASPMRPKDLHKLDAVKDLVVSQRTPIRVLHRRSALDRAKVIHSCACEYINSHFFILRLVASAGTYIKEFVHGDFGRTCPSVGSLLSCEADILQLDVEELIYT